VISQGQRPRLPRSYQAGRLLRLLAGDLPEHWVDQAGASRARFVPVNGGPVIDVKERVDRRFLGHNEIAQFEVRAPAGDTSPARLQILHTGRFKRGGVMVTVTEGDEPVRSLAAQIEQDGAFVNAVTPLDFTRFDVRRGKGEWVATVELMGASFVSLALPPMRSYVRLHSDQRMALVDSLTSLVRRLSGR
jgi:hypothetical protein